MAREAGASARKEDCLTTVRFDDPDLVKVRDVGELLPEGLHRANATAWAKHGLKVGKKQIRLPSLLIGKTRWTNKRAVQEFLEEFTRARDGEEEPTPRLRSQRQRESDMRGARAVLEAAGI
jgi:hypothetical protein